MSDDYIKRGEAEKRLFETAEIANSAYINQEPCQIMMLAQNVVHLIPAADVVEREKGEWIPLFPTIYNRPYCYECSRCGFTNERMTNYCPHCGAMMEGCE